MLSTLPRPTVAHSPANATPVRKFSVTPRELQVLQFVHAFRSAHPMGPTLQEIADALSCSKSVAFYHVSSLLKDYDQNMLCAEFTVHGTLREGSLHVAPEIAAQLSQD